MCLLYGTDDVEEALRLDAFYRDQFPKELIPGVLPFLAQLRTQEVVLGVVTATTRHNLENDLTSLGFPAETFSYSQTSDDTPYHKPDPRVFAPTRVWLDRQGILPTEVLYVGDGLHDMAAARGASFRFIGVETGLVSATQFAEAGSWSVPSILELLR